MVFDRIPPFFKSKSSVLLFLTAVAFLLYYPILTVGFLSDDYGFIYQLQTYGWSAFSHNFNDPFFIPISHFIATVVYYATDGSPYWFHILQLTLHAIIGWQLYLLLLDLKLQSTLAVIAAFIFVIMPFQSEAVVWLAAKSYEYALFFSVLSIRYFIKWQSYAKKRYMTAHFVLLLVAILSKELAYCIPFCLLSIAFISTKETPYLGSLFRQWRFYILAVAVLYAASFFLRYVVLNQFIGGYGSAVHQLEWYRSVTHFGAWIFKYLTFFRYGLQGDVMLAITILVSLLLALGVAIGLVRLRPKFSFYLGFFMLFIFVLLPVLSLEITSVKSIESERYGYFLSVIFAVIFAFSIIQFKTVYFTVFGLLITSIFVLFIRLDLKNWESAGLLTNSFMTELYNQDIQDATVLLINVPDNFNGVYCLRNGIDEALLASGFNTKVSVMYYQSFTAVDAGIVIAAPDLSSIKEPQGATVYYAEYPVRTFTIADWNKNLLNSFDKVFAFSNQQFTVLK